MKRQQFLTEFIEAALNCTVTDYSPADNGAVLTIKHTNFLGQTDTGAIHAFVDRQRGGTDTFIRFKYTWGWAGTVLAKEPVRVVNRGQSYMGNRGLPESECYCFVYSPKAHNCPKYAATCRGLEIWCCGNYPWNKVTNLKH